MTQASDDRQIVNSLLY